MKKKTKKTKKKSPPAEPLLAALLESSDLYDKRAGEIIKKHKLQKRRSHLLQYWAWIRGKDGCPSGGTQWLQMRSELGELHNEMLKAGI